MEDREQESRLVDRAVAGDREALNELLTGVQDLVFNLSLRMLGTVPDAEDAAQEIMVRVMTSLATFRKESAFSTWVFRIGVNHLKDYKKHRFAQAPLSFELYGEDIRSGRERDMPDLSQGVDRQMLSEELKLSCTNVMLQCLDPESRCVFILGTMFHLDSRVAGEVLGISPEAYRKRYSRVRQTMAEFLSGYCGLGGRAPCRCRNRVDYAVATHRLDPRRLEFSRMETVRVKEAMERVEEQSDLFAGLPHYRTTGRTRDFIRRLLSSPEVQTIKGGAEHAGT